LQRHGAGRFALGLDLRQGAPGRGRHSDYLIIVDRSPGDDVGPELFDSELEHGRLFDQARF
jgi:hypothetical protein